MALIYAAAALGAVLFCASLVLLQKKSAPPQAGKTHSVRWQDIVEVKTTVTSKRVTLRTAKETVSVNGDPRHYRAFVQQLYDHVPAHVGSDTLGQLLQRLN